MARTRVLLTGWVGSGGPGARVAPAHDGPFLQERAAGERLAARLRLVVVGGACLQALLPGTALGDRALALALGSLALLVALLLYLWARRVSPPWLAVVSSAVDVSLVSAGLGMDLLLDRPAALFQPRPLFDAYFLAIVGTALRHDGRASLVAGLLALGQYGLLVTLAGFTLGQEGPGPGAVATRLGLLAATALVTTTVVVRAGRLRLLSTTDRLTGLASRTAFEQRLQEELGRARRYERPLTVALLDVDHFKRLNDAHGHAGGDLVLRVLAETLVAALRRTDTVARYGGEEFALILPETSPAAALGRIEALRRMVAATPIDTGRGGGPVHVTVSVGVAGWPEDGADIGEVLARADARLYEAKRRGRDRIVGPAGGGAPPGGG